MQVGPPGDPPEMSVRFSPGLCLAVCLSLSGATLEEMSLDDLTLKSTSIVRGTAGESRAARVGPLIYTFTTFRVAENLKGEPVHEVEIALPGGRIGELSQHFGGVPRLEAGAEYLVFLWRGASGVTQITGLSQGLIEVETGRTGEQLAVRAPNADLVVSPGTGKAVKSTELRIPLADLTANIRGIVAAGGQPQR